MPWPGRASGGDSPGSSDASPPGCPVAPRAESPASPPPDGDAALDETGLAPGATGSPGDVLAIADPAAPPRPAAAQSPRDRASSARSPSGLAVGHPATDLGSRAARAPQRPIRRGPAPREAQAPVPSPLAARLNAIHLGILSHGMEALRGCREAGEALIEAKALEGHGRFLAWVADNCEFGARVAENHIEIARGWARIEEAARSNAHDGAYLSQSWARKVLKDARARTIPAGPPAEGGAVAAGRDPGGDGASAAVDSRDLTPDVIDVEFAPFLPASPEDEHHPAGGPPARVGLPAPATPAASPGGDRPRVVPEEGPP